jgi:uncharacterized repeat protein (TIGR04076 family)
MADIHDVKITVLKRMHPKEVFDEPPFEPSEPMNECSLFTDGQKFTSKGGAAPKEFPCTAAWISLYPDVRVLAFGGNMPWFKKEGVSVICCPDGLRPVIFKLERV